VVHGKEDMSAVSTDRFRVSCEFVHVNDPPEWWSAYTYPHALDRDAADRLANDWRTRPNYRNVRVEPHQ
jgi:hypothetical protein